MNGISKNQSVGKLVTLRHSGKSKENPNVTRNRQESSEDTEASTHYIPVIRTSQNSSTLLKYANVLSRSVDDGVTMDDLDALQQDLEKLLSTCAVRNRFLRMEIESIDKEERRDRRGKQTSLKRKRQDDRLKPKDAKNGTRVVKKHGLNVNNFLVETPPVRCDVPKIMLPKHDTSEKFWATVEPFCAEIQKEDVAFINTLIEECSKEISVKIPDIGDHYTTEWTDELLFDEHNGSNAKNNDFKKNGINMLLDTLSQSKTQSILSGFPAQLEKLKVADLNIFKNYNGKSCMEKRLKKELLEQGILNVDDLQKSTPDDEVLAEIKKCQHELMAVNNYNKKELNKLRENVIKDLSRQEIKESLDKCDKKVMDLYKEILQAKQKALLNEDMDKHVINEQISKKFESQADDLVEQQYILNRQLLDLTNTMRY